jgi:hypothetical protein
VVMNTYQLRISHVKGSTGTPATAQLSQSTQVSHSSLSHRV